MFYVKWSYQYTDRVSALPKMFAKNELPILEKIAREDPMRSDLLRSYVRGVMRLSLARLAAEQQSQALR